MEREEEISAMAISYLSCLPKHPNKIVRGKKKKKTVDGETYLEAEAIGFIHQQDDSCT